MKKLDHISIDFLNLSKRTYHALVRSRVLTIGDLNKRIINGDLIQIQFVGEKSLDEISKALRELYKNPPKVIEKEKTKDNLVSIGNTNVNMLDQIPIDNLELPRVIRFSLKKNKIETFGELRNLSDAALLEINRIGSKSLEEIRQIIAEVINNPDKYTIKDKDKQIIQTRSKIINLTSQRSPIGNWAEMVQGYFESEKVNYTFILLSRFGFNTKTLKEIAGELGVTRERVRQIQELVSVRFLKYLRYSSTGFSSSSTFLEKVVKIFSTHGDNLSLTRFKNLLQKNGLLGKFTKIDKKDQIQGLDLLETLICWLNLLADKRYNMNPMVFPINIRDLVQSGDISIKDRNTLLNISKKKRRKIRRKVLFTGGITINEAAKILSTDKKIAVLVMKSLNLRKVNGEWFSFRNLDNDQDNSKIPLRSASLKMLEISPEMDIETFHDGLRKYAARFYSSIAPIVIIKHILPMLGFEIKNSKVFTHLSTKDSLSDSEKSLISAIRKNGDVVSFLEIAEEFFLHDLSLPAVSVTLKRSPIAEKVDEGLYKLRGTEISWQDIDVAQKRQKRFAQDDSITHGLDGKIRMRFTVNSYAYLTGVVGASSLKEISGSWDLVHDNSVIGIVKIEDPYMWGLVNRFKEMDVKMGDRMELAFNTWNRTLTVRKAENENP